MRVALLGDTMLGRGVGDSIAAAAAPFSPRLRASVRAADCVIANLECCISDRGEKWDPLVKRFHFRAPVRAIEVLSSLGVDAVTLANNHALDYGLDAFEDTLRYLRTAGIAVAGAGPNVDAARRGTLITKNGFRLGLLGFVDHQRDFGATARRGGTAFADIRHATPPWIGAEIRALRASADAVVVMPHWGPNMTTEPLPYIRTCAWSLLDAGATLVAGHSAHVFHGIAPNVIYDLGDAVDDYARYADVRNDIGIVVFAELGSPQLEVLPIALSFCHTDIAVGANRDWAIRRLTAACSELGTDVAVQPDTSALLVRW